MVASTQRPRRAPAPAAEPEVSPPSTQGTDRKPLIVKKLEAMQAKARAKRQTQAPPPTPPTAPAPDSAAIPVSPSPVLPPAIVPDITAKPSTLSLLKDRHQRVNGRLFALEQQGKFKTYPIKASSEFPTLLTRLPIFRPTHRARHKALLNADNSLEFSTPFGEGVRHGPLLTVRDEDTLIAIMRLRDRRLFGQAADLPIPISALFNQPAGNTEVHAVLCTVQDINQEKRLTNGGENYRATVGSIKRLAGTTLELTSQRFDRYLGAHERGRSVKLLDVEWELYDQDGILFIQIPPAIATWLVSEYTYINWRIRLQLNDLGKCLHRFLSSQPKRYQGQVLKIAQSIGYDGPTKNVKQRFREALIRLVELGWLDAYTFSGTGRGSPLMLRTDRR